MTKLKTNSLLFVAVFTADASAAIRASNPWTVASRRRRSNGPGHPGSAADRTAKKCSAEVLVAVYYVITHIHIHDRMYVYIYMTFLRISM